MMSHLGLKLSQTSIILKTMSQKGKTLCSDSENTGSRCNFLQMVCAFGKVSATTM